jgi:hypothetical protein
MAACAAKGFDGVDPDNVDGWDGNDTGFPLTAADQITYNKCGLLGAFGGSLCRSAVLVWWRARDWLCCASLAQCACFTTATRTHPVPAGGWPARPTTSASPAA